MWFRLLCWQSILKRIECNITHTTKGATSQSPKQQKKVLNKFAFEFEEKVKKGKCFDGERVFFEGFMFEWLDDLKIRVTNNTYETYRMNLKNNIVPFFKDYKLGEIDTRLAEKFCAGMIDKYAHATIVKCKNILNSMFEKVVCWTIIETNPCTNASIPKSKRSKTGLNFSPNSKQYHFFVRWI